MKKQLWIFLLVLLLSARVQAQIRVDAAAGLGITTATTSFSSLPQISTCCPLFTSGSGVGLVLGAGLDVPIFQSLFTSVRFSFANRNHILETREDVDIIVQDRLLQSTFAHSLAMPMQENSIDLLLGYRFGPLALRLGAGYSLRSYGTLLYKEEIVSPQDVFFTDSKSRVRNSQTSELPLPNQQGWSAIVAASVDIPLGKKRTFILTPEILLNTSLSSISQFAAWHITSPTFSVRLAYEFPRQAATLPDTSLRSTLDKKPTTIPPTLEQTQLITSVEKQKTLDIIARMESKIKIEELEGERYLPILPYVFFDFQQASIPKRYALDSGDISNKASVTSISLHHQFFRLLAERMRQFPNAKLLIKGTISADESDSALARQRAQTVVRTLATKFGIPEKRIQVLSGFLPTLPTKPTASEATMANEENRRVEFSSTQAELFMPYRLADTLYSVTPPYLTIETKTTDNMALRNWSLRVNGTTVDSSLSPISKNISVALSNQQAQQALQIGNVVVSASGILDGQKAVDSLTLPITSLRLSEKRKEKRNDSIVERFELIVFPFNKAELTSAHQKVLDLIRSKIGDRARIEITGCTDILGNFEDNAILSFERAKSVSRELPGNHILLGRGEPEASQSQILPEERMFQRVVKITAYVPTE